MLSWQPLLRLIDRIHHLWLRLQARLRARPWAGSWFSFDDELLQSLQALAERDRRPAAKLAAELIAGALAQRKLARENLRVWQTLTPREQQVAALVCLDYTNRQIAGRLGVSPETVRTHLRNLLAKYELRTKTELRLALTAASGWDFQDWEAADFGRVSTRAALTKLRSSGQSNKSNISL